MPLPGWIPLSVIWIVLFILLIEFDAKASIAIKNLGFVDFTTLLIISALSIPVFPITFGVNMLTFLTPSDTSLFANKNRCLVTIILFNTFGPKLSGVDFSFPKPIIKQLSLSFIFIYL